MWPIRAGATTPGFPVNAYEAEEPPPGALLHHWPHRRLGDGQSAIMPAASIPSPSIYAASRAMVLSPRPILTGTIARLTAGRFFPRQYGMNSDYAADAARACDHFDEWQDAHGVRVHWRRFFELESAVELASKQGDADRQIRDNGITYNVYADTG